MGKILLPWVREGKQNVTAAGAMGSPRLREKKMRTELFSGHHHNPAAWPNLRVPVPGARTFVEAKVE